MSTAPSLSAASQRLPSPVLAVTARTLVWIAWLMGLFIWVPRVENVFQRLNIVLPSSVKLFAKIHGEVPFPFILAAVFILLDWTVSPRLHRPGARALWSGLMTLAPFAAIILTTLALSRSMLAVLEIIARG